MHVRARALFRRARSCVSGSSVCACFRFNAKRALAETCPFENEKPTGRSAFRNFNTRLDVSSYRGKERKTPISRYRFAQKEVFQSKVLRTKTFSQTLLSHSSYTSKREKKKKRNDFL